jgi:ABC-type microcin C transport system duplicated ATPase subunit YejF
MKRIFVLSASIYLFALVSLGKALSTVRARVQFHPSPVEIENFTLSFPLTWQRRFLSSVPYRERALDNINVSLREFCFIRGASSSGKSTLLKTILNQRGQSATTGGTATGTVTLVSRPDCPPAKPIYLDQKPPYEDRLRIKEVIDRQWSLNGDPIDKTIRAEITSFFANYLGLQDGQADDWLQRKPSELSPSETYRFALLLACFQSSCSSDIRRTEDDKILLPAPILLLDEWMDTETSTVIQAVQQGLWTLVQATGALVAIVSHKPERWRRDQISQTITMSGGRVLYVE